MITLPNLYKQFFVTVDAEGMLTASYPSPSQWDDFKRDDNGALTTVPMRPAEAVEVSADDFSKLVSRKFKYVNGAIVAV